MLTVYDLATEDTVLRKAAINEFEGACPNYARGKCRCGTDGFRVRWSGERYVFMCRGCWDAGEMLPSGMRRRGWGDEIRYLKHFRDMSHRQAVLFLAQHETLTFDEALAQLTRYCHMSAAAARAALGEHAPDGPQADKSAVCAINRHLPGGRAPGERDGARIPGRRVPGEKPLDYRSLIWQENMQKTVQEQIARLHSPDDPRALDYAHQRGLTDKTIQAARLGYAVQGGIPRLIIPSVHHGQYVAIYRRDLRPDCPKAERWKDAPGGTKRELYLADCLKRKLTTILTEAPLDALSVVQACEGMLNVVATGGAGCAQSHKNVAQLARMPLVLVAFDADEAGDKAASWWLKRLRNAQRLRPALHDVNDMLVQGWNLHQWLLDAIQQAADPCPEPAPITPAAEPPQAVEATPLPTTQDSRAVDEALLRLCASHNVVLADPASFAAFCYSADPAKAHFATMLLRIAHVFPKGCTIGPIEAINPA